MTVKAAALKLLVASLFVMGTAFQAQAADILIDPALVPNCGDPVCLVTTGNQTSMSAILAIIQGLGVGDSLYKSDQTNANPNGLGVDSGSAAPWYETWFANTPTDPSKATIKWVGPGFISSNPVYVLVKDGNSTPAWYLYNISGWNGQDKIILQNFWPQRGAISNVSIYGTTTSVPDGGAIAMLLGAALLGLAGVGRKLT
jgi:hypothetical protein